LRAHKCDHCAELLLRIIDEIGRGVSDDAASGAVTANPAGLVSAAISLVGTLVGGGALPDNRRKDRKMKERKARS